MDLLTELAARKDITDSIMRYARGVDRRDWALVRAQYHDDAVDWHGDYHGDADGFIAWVSLRHAPIPFSMHFIGNILIEMRSDTRAAVETYFIALQRRLGLEEHGTDFEVFGRYVDIFEKRDGVWRVASRKVVYDSTATHSSTHHLRALQGVFGQRDKTDPVYATA